MPITVDHGMPASVIAQGSYAAGQGRYRRYLDQLAQQKADREQQERMQIRGLDYNRQQFLDGAALDRQKFLENMQFQNFSDGRRLAYDNQSAYRDQGFRQGNAVLDAGLQARQTMLQGGIQGALAQQEDARQAFLAAQQNQMIGERQKEQFGLEADLRRELMDRGAELDKQRRQDEFTEGQRRFTEQVRNDFAAIDEAQNNGYLSAEEAELARRQAALNSANISNLPSPIPKNQPTVGDEIQNRVVPVEGVPGAFWIQQPDGKLEFKEAKPQQQPEPAVSYDDFATRYQEAFNQLSTDASRGIDSPPPTQAEIIQHMQQMDAAYQGYIGQQQQQPQGMPQQGMMPPQQQQAPQQPAMAPPAAQQITPEQAAAILENPAQANFAAATPGPAVPMPQAMAQVDQFLAQFPGDMQSGASKQRGEEAAPLSVHPRVREAMAYTLTYGDVPVQNQELEAFAAQLPLEQRAHLIAAGRVSKLSGLFGMPTVRSKEEWDLLPPGIDYIDLQDGKVYSKSE